MSHSATAAAVAALNEAIESKPSATLVDAARRLVVAREKAEQASLVYRAKLAEFNERYSWLAEDKKAAEAVVAEAEGEVKLLARAHYNTTGNAKPFAGIEVKLFKVYSYDAARALEWARETKMALVPESLDVKAFEKIAAATPLPFVTLDQDPRVQLGKTIELPPEALQPAELAALDALLGGAE